MNVECTFYASAVHFFIFSFLRFRLCLFRLFLFFFAFCSISFSHPLFFHFQSTNTFCFSSSFMCSIFFTLSRFVSSYLILSSPALYLSLFSFYCWQVNFCAGNLSKLPHNVHICQITLVPPNIK